MPLDDGLCILSLVLFIVVVVVVVVKVGVAIPALLLGPLFYIQVGGTLLLLEKLVWGGALIGRVSIL